MNDDDLFDDARSRTIATSNKKPRTRKAEFGQYFTSDGIAAFMASWFRNLSGPIKLLDAGAGAGALTSAFVKHVRENGFDEKLTAFAFEKDETLIAPLRKTLTAIKANATIIEGDFIQKAATDLKLSRGERYTHAILNPPYGKINSDSENRTYLRAIGLETVNLYSGFVGLAIDLLMPGGELIAIIPRSFCNGPYYQPFRRWIFERSAIKRIHLFESRTKAFKADGVLQENIIIHLHRGEPQREVIVSTSTDDSFADMSSNTHSFNQIVYPGDAEQFIHIPTGDDTELLSSAAYGYSLAELGLSVATGPVIDFRMRDDMCDPEDEAAVPLLYTSHFADGELSWPKANFKKSNAIRRTRKTEKWLMPNGFYCLVKRFSSKEEKRRVVANVVDPSRLPPNEVIGFENHLNVIHSNKRPLVENVARGIAVYLNSTSIDRYFRRFNGHTQVNATDLRTMRYPSIDAIRALGDWALERGRISQQEIDTRVDALA